MACLAIVMMLIVLILLIVASVIASAVASPMEIVTPSPMASTTKLGIIIGRVIIASLWVWVRGLSPIVYVTIIVGVGMLCVLIGLLVVGISFTSSSK